MLAPTSCVKPLVVSVPGLPGGDQRGSGEQAAAAGDGRAPGQGQPRQQSCRDPAQTEQSQRALAASAGPHRCQVGAPDSCKQTEGIFGEELRKV